MNRAATNLSQCWPRAPMASRGFAACCHCINRGFMTAGISVQGVDYLRKSLATNTEIM